MEHNSAQLQIQNRWTAIQLAGIAVASGLIYWLVFVRPASFFALYGRVKFYQDYLHVAPPATRWWVVAAFLVLGLLYGLGWKVARQARGRDAWLVVLIGSLVFGILLSYLYPIDASDLFNNILIGRIQGIYEANPFVQVANQFKSDPFFPYVSWSDVPSAYGPVWELMAGETARIAGNGIATNILAFKWLPGVFMLGSIGIVADILRRKGSQQILAGTLLLAWNPIALYETWGNGHNDIVMIFWVLLTVWALLQKHHVLAVLSLVIGALTKFIPILLIPAAVLISLRELTGWRARIRFLGITAAAAALLIVLTYSPFWEGPKVLSITRRTHLFTTSLPAVLYRVSIPSLGKDHAAALVSTGALILTLGVALWQGLRAWRNPSAESFSQASFNILAFYLLVTCLWFQQWYTVWLIALAPVLELGAAQLFAVLFGFSAISKQLFLYPILIWPNPRPPQPGFEIKFALGVLGFPWLLSLVLLCRKKIPPLPIHLPRRTQVQRMP